MDAAVGATDRASADRGGRRTAGAFAPTAPRARNGCAVAVALNGTDGLRMARHDRYDVIVLDLMLPGLNGYRLCAELRSASVWTPILVLTAKDGELDESEALDTGADGYLRKPFWHVVLLAHLRRSCAVVNRPARPCSPPVTCRSIRRHAAAGGE